MEKLCRDGRVAGAGDRGDAKYDLPVNDLQKFSGTLRAVIGTQGEPLCEHIGKEGRQIADMDAGRQERIAP